LPLRDFPARPQKAVSPRTYSAIKDSVIKAYRTRHKRDKATILLVIILMA
jgi:hypothetical protein